MRYQRIKELCKANGITVTGLEKELGFARGSLSKIDNHLPSADKVNKLANRLNTTPDYILYGTRQEHESSSGKKYYFDDNTAELAQKMFSNPQLRTLMSSSSKLQEDDVITVQNLVCALLRKDGKVDD